MRPADPVTIAARLLLGAVELDEELAAAAGAYLSRWGAAHRARQRALDGQQQVLRFPVCGANDASVSAAP